MATPKRRTSRSVMKQRRTHKKLTILNTASCSHCQELILPHIVCPHCGHYRNRKIIVASE